MSTYVPGVETYLPDIKPFTPDYKFLSSVLQSRQDKYNRNWQATNDLYSKIVYAPLSRQDNLDKREQYIEQIKPSIEKISGLDLSIQQNVDSAKAVFAPFYEDDLLVKDMLYTTNYQNEMAYANRLLDSPDETQRGKWWETGIKDLQYKMQDFQNASGDAALAMGMPRYVDDVNLYQMAEKYLSELDPPLKITAPMNLFVGEGRNRRFNTDADFIITQTNGELVTGPALEMIKNRFIDDPAVQRAYYTQAFVKGRDFADEGVRTGEFSSIQEGQQVWAQQTIDLIGKQNDFLMQKTTKALQREANGVTNWETYAKNNGIIPGSQDEKIMREQYNSYEATKAALASMQNIKDVSKTPVKDYNGTLQKAYQLILMNSIGSDLTKAARDFSMRDYNLDYKVNELKRDKVRHQRAKELVKYRSDLDLANKRKLAIEKGEILDPRQKMLVDLLGQRKAKAGGPSQILAAVDDEGKIIRDKQLENAQIYSEDSDKLLQQKIETIIDGKLMFNPKGDGGTGSYTITLDNGETVSGSIEKIKNALSAKDENGNYINTDAIEKQMFDLTRLTDQQTGASMASKQHPSLINTPEYINFYNKLHGSNSISNQEGNLYIEFTKANDKILKVYQDTKKEFLDSKGNDDIRSLLQSGFSDILDENGKLSSEEYVNEIMRKLKAGEIDDSLNNYIITRDMTRKEMDDLYGPARDNAYAQQVRRENRFLITRIDDISESRVKKDAEKVYNFLNNKVAKSPAYDQLLSIRDARRGRSGQDDDIEPYPIYATNVNPAAMSNDAKEDFINLLMQKDRLESTGAKYGIVVGDQVESKEDYLKQSDLANKLFDVLADNVNFYLTTDKATKTSIKNVPQFQLEYSPVYGSSDDLTKSKAGITIKPNAQWLNSFQKGGESFETGLFTSDQINQLQNGITIIFDQQEDVNPKARSQEYYSPLISEVELSTNNFVDKKYPGIDSMPTGDYSITKRADDYYYVTYSFNVYQDSGKDRGRYTPTEEMSRIIDLRGQSDKGLQFDKIMNETVFTAFEVNKNMNDQKKARDVKMNGSK